MAVMTLKIFFFENLIREFKPYSLFKPIPPKLMADSSKYRFHIFFTDTCNNLISGNIIELLSL